MKPCGLQRKAHNEIPEASLAVHASYNTQCCGAVEYRRNINVDIHWNTTLRRNRKAVINP